MSTDPTLPPSLAAEIAELKRRLNNLERSPRLPFSSTRGGAFKFIDDAGGPRFLLGNGALNAQLEVVQQNTYGVALYGDDAAKGFVMAQGYRGIAYPRIILPMARLVDDPSGLLYHVTTSGTFESIMSTTQELPSHEVVEAFFAVISDSGTVGEVRLLDVQSGLATNALSVNTSGAIKTAKFQWIHPATVGLDDPRGGRDTTLALRIQGRRVSGAGSLFVYWTTRVAYTSLLLAPNASTNGNPQLL